ncbi:hypothetical protein ABVT39_018878 [Epinephelus coioides]
MLTIFLQRGELDPVTVGKTNGSVSAMAFRLTIQYRTPGFLLPDKLPPQVITSVFFLWNLFFISSRLTTLALFAAVLPCFIFTHCPVLKYPIDTMECVI